MSDSTTGTWQRTFVLLKPDCVFRSLTGQILVRFERAGLSLTSLSLRTVSKDLARRHYEEHEGKKFFEPLVSLLTSGPVVTMVVEGAHAVEVVRKLVGATEPLKAAPGTIRGDFCHMGYERSQERLGVIPNLVHASDSPESAEREISLWIDPESLSSWERCDFRFL